MPRFEIFRRTFVGLIMGNIGLVGRCNLFCSLHAGCLRSRLCSVMRRRWCCVLGVRRCSARPQEEKQGWPRVCICWMIVKHPDSLGCNYKSIIFDTVSHATFFSNRLFFQKKAALRRMKREWCFECKELCDFLMPYFSLITMNELE